MRSSRIIRPRRSIPRRVLLGVFISLAIASPAPADPPSFEQAPLCGIYAIYATTRLYGKTCDLRSLLQAEYVSSQSGSSFSDLQRAAESVGLNAAAVAGLSSADLRASTIPLVLHVRSSPTAPEYDHFVLYTPSDEEFATIRDGSQPAMKMSFAEVVSIWDGNALALSPAPIDTGKLFAPSTFRFYLLAGATLLVALTFTRIKPRVPAFPKPRKILVLQVLLIVTTSGTIALAYHVRADAGYLAGPHIMRGVEESHTAAFLPVITLDDLQKVIEEKDTLIIDARDVVQYLHGHVAGAVNVPLDAFLKNSSDALSANWKNRKIVLYCSDPACDAARVSGTILRSDGYSNVSIFDGGYAAWRARMPLTGKTHE